MTITLSALYEGGAVRFTHPRFALEETFDIATAVGFDGIDYLATLPDLVTMSPQVLELSKKYKLPILDVHAPLHLVFYTPDILHNKLLTLAAKFPDCTVLNHHLSGLFTPWQRSPKHLDAYVKKAQQKGVTVSFESNPRLAGLTYYPSMTWDPKAFGDFCIKHNVWMTFDTAHIADLGYDIVAFYETYHTQIKLIHLSDSRGKVQHLPFGEGELPLQELFTSMKKTNYNNAITFEINKLPKNASQKEKTEIIRKSYNFLRHYL